MCAFAISATASNLDRVGKPFNPLLGETYELVREDMGFKLIAEQVSEQCELLFFFFFLEKLTVKKTAIMVSAVCERAMCRGDFTLFDHEEHDNPVLQNSQQKIISSGKRTG